MTNKKNDNEEDARTYQEQELLHAKEAAKHGNPIEMIEALYKSKYLDGLAFRFSQTWNNKIPEIEIEQCIALAVDKTYDKLKNSGSIHHLSTWLYKVANNELVNSWRKDYQYRYEGSLNDELSSTMNSQDDSEYDTEGNEKSRTEALKIAREIVPTLGQENIVSVMTLILDAIEADIVDLPASQIAETLNLEEATVRKLKQRGFERLTEAAIEKGYHLNTEELSELKFEEIDD